MSESAVPAGSSVMGAPGYIAGAHQYALSSDLSRLCLPSEFKEPHRRLAWMNSICFLFLVVGLVGLKAPQVVVRPLSKVEDTVPVIFTPPPEQPKAEPEVKQDEPTEPQDTTADTPQVITVLAVANSSAVAFSVPVQGAVTVAEARYATPPPPVNYKPPQPTKFDPNAAGEGSYPAPNYPTAALRGRHQGTVTIEIVVDANGHGNIGQGGEDFGLRIARRGGSERGQEPLAFPSRTGEVVRLAVPVCAGVNAPIRVARTELNLYTDRKQQKVC